MKYQQPRFNAEMVERALNDVEAINKRIQELQAQGDRNFNMTKIGDLFDEKHDILMRLMRAAKYYCEFQAVDHDEIMSWLARRNIPCQ